MRGPKKVGRIANPSYDETHSALRIPPSALRAEVSLHPRVATTILASHAGGLIARSAWFFYFQWGMIMTICNGRYWAVSWVLLSVLVGAATAQETLTSQFDKVQGLQPFVGMWEADLPSDDGSAMKLNVFCRWTSNKSYAQFQFSVLRDEERTHVGTLTVGWNGADQCLNAWAFWPESVMQTQAEIGDGKLTYTGKGVTMDGKTTSADVSWTAEGDEVTVSVTNSVRGDARQPDMNVTLKRRARRE